MLRVIFDTNIYGRLLKEDDFEHMTTKIAEHPDFIVYGYRQIRQELRRTPKTSRLGGLSRRNLLLSVYDKVCKGKVLDNAHILRVAERIHKKYRLNGGIQSFDSSNIDVDFMIVACAMLCRLDIVVSNDVRTLLSDPARKAYVTIANEDGLKVPVFWRYEELRKRFVN